LSLIEKLFMDRNLLSLDLNTLKEMYEHEAEALNASLLQGVAWSSLLEQRKTVTNLSIALQAKRTGSNPPPNHPAEHSTRDDRNNP